MPRPRGAAPVAYALTFTGLAGAYWPVVIAGLYGAGALIAPPTRPPAPEFPDASSRLETLREYPAEVDLPPGAAGRLVELTDLLDGLLAPGWVSEALATDPEGVHALARFVHQDIPESVDTFVRTRWWTRVAPGSEPPERHLKRQLDLLHREAEGPATGLCEAETRRRRTHTRYLEDRGL
ncbi:hypothetical protein OG596_13745 [Streptomyces sp. NBC_01102]|uniref:hypothetical protein n=1 Tax=Streptomyces sp. NBC_01102 TaxID=2903749 RepID=UPI00386F622F|nr:hypothetical protein OG596_13745 [Streptomyces sp. NBC_01102]